MKKLLLILLVVACITGCKKTEQLEMHEAVMLDTGPVLDDQGRQSKTWYTYRDLKTGEVKKETTSSRLRIGPGEYFVKEAWVPIVH